MPKPDIKTLEKKLARAQEKVTRIQSEIQAARKRNGALRLREVASLLRVHSSTVRGMINEGRLKGFQDGSFKQSHWWVTKRSVVQLHKKISQSILRPDTDTQA